VPVRDRRCAEPASLGVVIVAILTSIMPVRAQELFRPFV
jgi:hypothetical protein